MTASIFSRLRQPRLTSALRALIAPLAGLIVFLMLWHGAAMQVHTPLGEFPGPAAVWHQAGGLIAEHRAERDRQRAFHQRQQENLTARRALDPDHIGTLRNHTGPPTFFDQIVTSLTTVLAGFGIATLIAVPLGIAVGLSTTLYRAFDPLIQLLKPISPLAWLPLVTLVVNAVYTSAEPMFARSFITSLITVLLCCLWPTVINTAIGVSRVESDWLNVSRVLRLGTLTHLRKIVLPAAVPAIFTGLRLSLSIAWMVLIAAEMLAQSPGLGKFVWDEFQNGSSQSLGRIMVAVIVIGLIGFLLDRLMLAGQRTVSWDPQAAIR